jgi:hypothetical protein
MLKNLNELQQLVDYAYFHHDKNKGDLTHGLTLVLQVKDLSTLCPDPVKINSGQPDWIFYPARKIVILYMMSGTPGLQGCNSGRATHDFVFWRVKMQEKITHKLFGIRWPMLTILRCSIQR